MPTPRLIGLLWVILLVAAGFLTGVPHLSVAGGGNLLRNPGFEAGTLGWRAYPSQATFAIVSEPSHGGQNAAALTKTSKSGPAFIYQDVPVLPGERYSAQAWAVWNDEQLVNVKLRVEWLDDQGNRLRLDDVAVNVRSPQYALLLLENLEAPPEAATARIQGYTYVRPADPEHPAFFDDFYFAALGVPTIAAEPSRPASTTPTVVLPTPPPTATPSPVPAGAVLINEVFYDPPAPGGDPDDEWVELYNGTEQAINLGGWVLADHIGEDVLPAVELPPGGFAVVAASHAFQMLYPSYDGLLITLGGTIGNGLANSGDSLWLRDNQDRVIDAMAYGDDSVAMFPQVPAAPEGYSLERIPYGRDTDTAADWFPRPTPSPGEGISIWRVYLPLVVR